MACFPAAWKEGSVKGLKARDGFEVSIQWRNQALSQATIKSLNGGSCTVKALLPIIVNGVKVNSRQTISGYVTSFETEKGRLYEVTART